MPSFADSIDDGDDIPNQTHHRGVHDASGLALRLPGFDGTLRGSRRTPVPMAEVVALFCLSVCLCACVRVCVCACVRVCVFTQISVDVYPGGNCVLSTWQSENVSFCIKLPQTPDCQSSGSVLSLWSGLKTAINGM